MTTSTIFKNTVVKSEGRGRPVSTKTAKVRRSVLRTLAENGGTELSTKQIAKLAKQSKTRVIAALYWAERNELIERSSTQKHDGRGRPMVTWTVSKTDS